MRFPFHILCLDSKGYTYPSVFNWTTIVGFVDLIAKELESLSPDEQAQVLDFVASLKAQQALAALPELTAEQASKRDELMAFYAAFNADLSGYQFDREDANARR